MGASKPQLPSSIREVPAERLDSWKEIAAYLKRDERTVRRWEREGLPVHRKVHKKQASVYAYKAEIEAWRNDGRQRLEQTELANRRKRLLWWVLASLATAGLAVLAALGARRLLERARGTAAAPTIRSIAVLPLENLSGDPSQEYFADGMTDELITDLAKIRSLKVISRTSVMQYKGTRKPLRQIASELKVDAVVEGSVARSGNQVRVTAQLIQAPADRHLWAESYQRDLGDVLALQNEVARSIALEVRATLTPGESGNLQAKRPVNPEAYEAYLRGRNEMGKQRRDAIKSSAQYFQKAIDLDPLYAPAYAGLADAFNLMANYFVLPPENVFPRAEAAARKALELDPSLGEAHAALAVAMQHYEWDWPASEAEHKKALAVAPGLSVVHLRYAEFLSNSGRHEEALHEISRAQQLDPLSLVVASNQGRYLYYARRYDEAIQKLQEVLTLDPNRIYTRIHLAQALEEQHRYPEAIAEFQRVVPSLGGFPAGLAHAYAAGGDRSNAEEVLKTLEEPAADATQVWYFIACAHVALGNKDKAFSWLEKASAHHDYFLTFLKVDPQMDPLRADPRFSRLLQRIGLNNKLARQQYLNASEIACDYALLLPVNTAPGQVPH